MIFYLSSPWLWPLISYFMTVFGSGCVDHWASRTECFLCESKQSQSKTNLETSKLILCIVLYCINSLSHVYFKHLANTDSSLIRALRLNWALKMSTLCILSLNDTNFQNNKFLYYLYLQCCIFLYLDSVPFSGLWTIKYRHCYVAVMCI